MKNIGGNVLLIKEVNLNIIRKAFKKLKTATKPQIAKATGLTTVTVGTMLQILLASNEIIERKQVKSNGGRPAVEFGYNFDYMNCLTFFIFEKDEKTFINIDIANLAGESIYKTIEEVEKINFDILKEVISKIIKKYENIKIIGFGNAGIEVDGTIMFSDYEELIGLNLSEEFEKEFGIPVIIENDVNAAVIGYGKRKQFKEEENMVYIYFPDVYGPGAGVLINGEIYKGKTNSAGEIVNIHGFEWNKEIYSDFEIFCTQVSKMINIISSVLNPEYFIINGSFITQEHVEYIRNLSKENSFLNFVPEIYLSENFLTDYRNGLVEKCLNELEPSISLTIRQNSIAGVDN